METNTSQELKDRETEPQEESVIELGHVSCETKAFTQGGIPEGGFTWFKF